MICGVGPTMEKQLQASRITTFYHLSKLDKIGVEALHDKLEFFPGRLERDDWIGQAKAFHKEMHQLRSRLQLISECWAAF